MNKRVWTTSGFNHILLENCCRCKRTYLQHCNQVTFNYPLTTGDNKFNKAALLLFSWITKAGARLVPPKWKHCHAALCHSPYLEVLMSSCDRIEERRRLRWFDDIVYVLYHLFPRVIILMKTSNDQLVQDRKFVGCFAFSLRNLLTLFILPPQEKPDGSSSRADRKCH